MSENVPVLVLTGYGLNCEEETAAAFTVAGATATQLHVANLIERPQRIRDFPIVVLIGGFAFGDHIASGRVLANRLRFRMGEWFLRHVDSGGLVLGICNGFQTIVKMGLLPALDRQPGEGFAGQTVSVVGNDRLGYRNAWVRLVVDAESPCVFTRGLGPELLEMPARHGEGKIILTDEDVRTRLERGHLVPVRYADSEGRATERWPDNPNGSAAGIAGLCDPTGRVFGLMPHPEAYLYPENHPRWLQQRDDGRLPARGFGVAMMENAVRAVTTG